MDELLYDGSGNRATRLMSLNGPSRTSTRSGPANPQRALEVKAEGDRPPDIRAFQSLCFRNCIAAMIGRFAVVEYAYDRFREAE
jgi:hypothetical protein